MANRAASALALRDGDRERLASMTRSMSVRAGLAQRARIVLLAADGVSNTSIADKVGVSRPTVIGWRDRYLRSGIAGLDDQPRSGRPRTVDHRAIVAETLKAPPKKLAVTHWSSRLLASHLGIGNATVARRGSHGRRKGSSCSSARHAIQDHEAITPDLAHDHEGLVTTAS
jgi:Winged helix-turn helix